MTAESKLVVEKLQNIKENDLTKNIIIPLLESIGFTKVEFFGGSTEEGKDIICWRNDELENVELVVAQVKHFKLTRKASGSRSFETVVNQLTNALIKKIPYHDRTLHLPSKVYLISTYEIDTKTIQKRFANEAMLKDHKISIIDGEKLASLLIKNRPDIIRDLVGSKVNISLETKATLNNDILLSAIGFRNERSLESIYTDIDFTIGRFSTKLFFNSEFSPVKKTFNIKYTEWNEFKNDINRITTLFSKSILDKSFNEIEETYQENKKAHDQWNEELDILNAKLTENKNSLSKIKNEKKQIEQELKKNYPELIKKRGEVVFSSESYKLGNLDEDSKRKYVETKSWLDKVQLPLKLKDEQIQEVSDIIIEIKSKIRKVKESEPSLKYKTPINGVVLRNEIIKYRSWIQETVQVYNDKKPSSSEIAEFFKKCKSIFEIVNNVYRISYLTDCLGISRPKSIRDLGSIRFKLPIELIFDSGQNIAVLGDAGAGKTTGLQMYALKKLKQLDNKLVIYIPLARAIDFWIQNEKGMSPSYTTNNLDVGITKYLNSLKISITSSEFREELRSNGAIILLDGIDEVIKTSPWVLSSIKKFARKYDKNVQVIVSSRMSGEYLNDIPFLAITLLPFTNEQRDVFIKKWFEESDASAIKPIQEHLNKNLQIGNIVKNPLLTTVLCVLAENRVPLPKSEVKLYDERLRLLTGYYDRAKEIKRISLPQYYLEHVAIKLAFHLHTKNKREEDRAVLQKISKNVITEAGFNSKSAVIAINELIDPCNILVPMDNGMYGFGHLRFQEHLSARELIHDRSKDIYSLLMKSWWIGTLKLFAQMCDNLKWLVEEAVIKMELSRVKAPLQILIKQRPEKEQVALNRIIKEHSHIDEMNELLSDDEYSTYYGLRLK